MQYAYLFLKLFRICLCFIIPPSSNEFPKKNAENFYTMITSEYLVSDFRKTLSVS